jgi:hypothetical protein
VRPEFGIFQFLGISQASYLAYTLILPCNAIGNKKLY